MKRTLIAAALVLVSGSALANEGFPQPSFNDNAGVPATVATGSRTVQNEFPKHGGSGLGGPTGAATLIAQFERVEPLTQAILVTPSFNG
jgi:uncharacterized protein YdeI (BOF family)